MPDATAKSVLRGYVSLVAAVGDRFLPTVARGRRDYGHPRQLVAMVRAGLCSEGSATWDTKPLPIPMEAERAFLEAQPSRSFAGAASLDWNQPPKYYMFKRRINRWSDAASVRRDLGDV
jgi:hypothetical protein